ncbi:putative reverse transcriptase domain-containing protein, partial [Tanacetum coccineum]
MEFRIDLIPGAAPVARAPYRLTPSEMKELSEQLQELSNKGFIRPTNSEESLSTPEDQRFIRSTPRIQHLFKDTFEIGLSPAESTRTIHSKDDIPNLDKKEHEEHLKAILELLKNEKLYAKFSKCEFWIPKVLLVTIKGSKDFMVYCDASHKGLGDVLMQREKIWRHYLHGTKCTVFIDHKSLQHILDQKELNMRQHRWLELL